MLPRLKEFFRDQVDELSYHSPLMDGLNGYQNMRTKIKLDGKMLIVAGTVASSFRLTLMTG